MVMTVTATTQPEIPRGNARFGAITASTNWCIGASMLHGKMGVHILRLEVFSPRPAALFSILTGVGFALFGYDFMAEFRHDRCRRLHAAGNGV